MCFCPTQFTFVTHACCHPWCEPPASECGRVSIGRVRCLIPLAWLESDTFAPCLPRLADPSNQTPQLEIRIEFHFRNVSMPEKRRRGMGATAKQRLRHTRPQEGHQHVQRSILFKIPTVVDTPPQQLPLLSCQQNCFPEGSRAQQQVGAAPQHCCSASTVAIPRAVSEHHKGVACAKPPQISCHSCRHPQCSAVEDPGYDDGPLVSFFCYCRHPRVQCHW